jgi:hypothetical protein
MTQLSLIPALEAARRPVREITNASAPQGHAGDPMAPANRPTAAQIAYLKRLTGIRTNTQLARYVARKASDSQSLDPKSILTKRDFAEVIDLEVAGKRWSH